MVPVVRHVDLLLKVLNVGKRLLKRESGVSRNIANRSVALWRRVANEPDEEDKFRSQPCEELTGLFQEKETAELLFLRNQTHQTGTSSKPTEVALNSVISKWTRLCCWRKSRY